MDYDGDNPIKMAENSHFEFYNLYFQASATTGYSLFLDADYESVSVPNFFMEELSLGTSLSLVAGP